MKTTLVIDYDGSLASLGGEEQRLIHFGIPPIQIFKGLEQTKLIIKQLIKPVKRTIKHPLFNEAVIEEDGFELSDKAKKMNLNCLVFDTISALGLQERTQLKSSKRLDTLDQRSWGIYGDSLNAFIYNICRLPIKVIFNVHIDRERDPLGESLELPALKGGAKNEIQKWMDIILFTRINQDSQSKDIQFMWQTKPMEGRFAKDRLNLLPMLMPQDYEMLFKKYEDAGINHPKILVLGDSGTGKTRSLATINANAIKTKAAPKAA